MIMQAKFETDLTVRSFAYIAEQLARSPAAQYDQILSEAEKHCSALRLAQRDIFEMMEQELRKRTLTKAEFLQLRESAAQTVAQARNAITRIAAKYAPRKLAA